MEITGYFLYSGGRRHLQKKPKVQCGTELGIVCWWGGGVSAPTCCVIAVECSLYVSEGSVHYRHNSYCVFHLFITALCSHENLLRLLSFSVVHQVWILLEVIATATEQKVSVSCSETSGRNLLIIILCTLFLNAWRQKSVIRF